MQDKATTEPAPLAAPSWRKRLQFGLSAKLLALTLAVIMLAEVLIFVPSVANFRKSWLEDRLRFAQIAALVAEAAPEGKVPEALRDELLKTAQVKALALKRHDMRMPILLEDMPPEIDETFDLRSAGSFKMVWDAIKTLIIPSARAIRVIGNPGDRPDQFVEIVMLEPPLKKAMLSFGLRVLGLSVLISLVTAAIVYLALNGLLVRPIERMVANMMRFSADPEDARRIIQTSARKDEIGIAEHQLAQMQRELAQVIHQKTRLAALGLAVSKINHDLRNMLANAQLISDRFQNSTDPTVQRFAPKLIGSLDRAIKLCTDTLKFGRAEEAPPQRRPIGLKALLDDVTDGLGLPIEGRLDVDIRVPAGLTIDADPDQMFRVFSNLLRNSAQVLEAATASTGEVAKITVSAQSGRALATVLVADTGPGIPPLARQHMFEAFKGSARKGGTGLGLAICAEILRSHGGRIELADSSPKGTVFRLEIPVVSA